MYDYVDGKADWMAYGLPVEGEDGPFLGEEVSEAPTCDVGLSVADARRVLDEPGVDLVVLVGGDGLAVADVDGHTLEGIADDVRLLEVLRPVPSTVRPSVTVASVAEAGGGRRLVTTSDGRLVGQATVEAADAGDDNGHEGHHHDGAPAIDIRRYERELADVMQAVEARFGDREPPADELRTFLRDRLVEEGRSDKEADQFLEGLDHGDAG